MMRMIVALVLPVIGVLVVIAMVALVVNRERRRAEQRWRAPFANDLLREPGHSLRKEIGVVEDRLLMRLMGCIFVVSIVGNDAALAVEGALHFSASTWVLLAVLVVGSLVLLGPAVILDLRRLRRYRQGYLGEVATAQELDRLRGEGYHVFHDIEADYGNVDHVLVGPTGVYAVETKARSKPKEIRGQEGARATFDGGSIRFPDGLDKTSLAQAKRQAEWVHRWLSSATADAVWVTPVVSLPGWYVENEVRPNGVVVTNPKTLAGFLRGRLEQREPLAPATIQRIVHQLEQRCRDVTARPKKKRAA